MGDSTGSTETSAHGFETVDDPLLSERAKQFEAPTLQSKHLFLRAVQPEDYPYLHLVETSGAMAARWGLRGAAPSFQDWMQQRGAGVLAQFIIVKRGRGSQERIGLVTVFAADFQDGHARVAALNFNPSGDSPLMMLGLALFIDYGACPACRGTSTAIPI